MRQIFVTSLLILGLAGFAQSQGTPDRTLQDLKFSGQWFLAFQAGENGNSTFNDFNLKRGYITVQKQLNDRISGRITQDISVDREGDGEGDIELRLKYCYLKYKFSSAGILTHSYLEFGLVHRPWLDFEEHINHYRVQGTMFLERNAVFNSADYGLTLVSLLGGEMDASYQKNISKSYPGRFGSLAVGIYNGGGYHAIEKNKNKSIEGRLTIRPLTGRLPGLQLSYQGAYGKGNTALEPDWHFQSAFLSYECRRLVLTGMYYNGKGNFKGNALISENESAGNSGYSIFADVKIANSLFYLFGRYDYFSQETAADEWQNTGAIFGLAYHLAPGCTILLDRDQSTSKNIETTENAMIEVAVEIHY